MRRNLWRSGNFLRVLYVIYSDNMMLDARLCVVLGRESVCVCVCVFISRESVTDTWCVSALSCSGAYIIMKVWIRNWDRNYPSPGEESWSPILTKNKLTLLSLLCLYLNAFLHDRTVPGIRSLVSPVLFRRSGRYPTGCVSGTWLSALCETGLRMSYVASWILYWEFCGLCYIM